MDKPISVAMKETRAEIEKAINNSLLPPVITSLIIGEIAETLNKLAQMQTEQEQAAYNKQEEKGKENGKH